MVAERSSDDSPGLPARPARRIPEATVNRLPLYLRSLAELPDDTATVSSERLAVLAGVNAAKVRKDLSYLGSFGTRGVGYEVEHLRYQMARQLGLTQDWPVLIVGVGDLGHALAKYDGFLERGFPVVALVDADAGKVGSVVEGLEVHDVARLGEIVAAAGVTTGIIATPAAVAQEVADQLVAAGVRSILNFAPVVLSVPPGVSVRKVDLAMELQILAFYEQHRSAPAGAGLGIGEEG